MRVIYAGGGTGGHINPAISIADYAKSVDNKHEALFIGTREGLETRLVPKAGYDIEYIDIQGFDRKHILNNITTVKKLLKARRDCKKIIKEFKPDCVVCTGGYVSGPVMMAAAKCGVGSIIHEQNVYPGLTVKGSEKYATYLALSFDETVNHMTAKDKCVVTGNPVRMQIINADRNAARKKLNIKKPFVLIFGGSLGAQKINDTVVSMLGKIINDGKISLMFGTGERNFNEVTEQLNEKGIELNEDVTVTPYIDNIADVMAAADLVVARSGAITVSELAILQKPSILIPSPNVVRNHQEQNAREFERQGAAEVILETDLTWEKLYDKIMAMVTNAEALKKMADSSKPLAKRDALQKIYQLMINISKEGK